MARWPLFKLGVLGLAAAVAFLLLRPLLTEILSAVMIAYLLRHPFEWLAPRLGPRKTAFGLILASTVFVVLPFVLLVSIALTGIKAITDQVFGEGETGVGIFETLYREALGPGFDLRVSIEEFVRTGDPLQVVTPLLETIGGISGVLVSVTLIVFIAYYLLVQGSDFLDWFNSKIPLAEEDKSELVARADGYMYVVVIVNIIVAVVDGLLVGIGLFFAGFSNVILLTVLAIFLAMIPVVGSMIIWVPAGLYLIATGSPVAGVLILGYGGILISSVENLLRPLIGANQSDMDPAIFIVGVFAGVSVLGFIGLFFGPVFLALTKAVFDVLELDVDDRSLLR